MKTLCCPHCGAALQPFSLPEGGGWDSDFHIACFNDECAYYVRGWDRMQTAYGVRSSYRFRIDPANGKQSPLAVWSPTAIKERILDAEIAVEDSVADHLPCAARPAP